MPTVTKLSEITKEAIDFSGKDRNFIKRLAERINADPLPGCQKFYFRFKKDYESGHIPGIFRNSRLGGYDHGEVAASELIGLGADYFSLQAACFQMLEAGEPGIFQKLFKWRK